MEDTTLFCENIDILIDDYNSEIPEIYNSSESINSSFNEYTTTDPSYFEFKLNHNQRSYMISAKNKTEIPSMIILPKEYKGLPVTKIKNNGFSDCTNLSIVMFEDKSNIKKIGLFAFYGCIQLESIELPQSIKSIKPGAFHSCSKLQQVYLHPKFPPKLGKTAFCQTSSSLEFYVPSKSVKLYKIFDRWEDYKKCIFSLPYNIPSNLGFFNFALNDDGETYTVYAKEKNILPSHLVIPSYYNKKDITIIGSGSFDNINIESLILPEKLVIIDKYAFRNFCNYSNYIRFKELTIPDSVERIEECAFGFTITTMQPDFVWSKSILEKVNFGEYSKLKYIGEQAFWGNMSLKEFVIPKGVTFIGHGALAGTGISHIDIPENVKTIETNPFIYCMHLKGIDVDKKNKYYKDIDGVLYNKDETELVSYPLGREEACYSIPNTVKSISGYHHFWGCVNLRVLYMNSPQPPSSLCKFDTALSAFKIYVPAYAYEKYKNAPVWNEIQSKLYPDNIIKDGFAIKNNTLIQYVENDSEITIPEDITQIQDYALTSCVNLKNIYVEQNNKKFKSINGVLFSPDLKKLICYPPAKTEEEYEIPKNVKILGSASFLGCKNLIQIKVHELLEIIEEFTFYRCQNLKELINIDAKDNIKSIGKYGFFQCSSMVEIELTSIETIDRWAFALCYNLIAITLGCKIKNIEYYIFLNPKASVKYIMNIFALLPPKLIYLRNIPESIYVPPQSLEIYKAANVWSNYKDRIYPLVKKIIK